MAEDVYLFSDGNFFLHRAWHASGSKTKYPERKIPNLILQWFCEGAVRVEAKYGAICFDGPRNFRKKLFPGYKISRADNSDTEHMETAYWEGKVASARTEKEMLRALVKPTMDLFQRHGIQAVQLPEYEADDLCISAAVKTVRRNPKAKVYIESRDKDFFQGVTEQITLFMPYMNKIPEKMYTPKGVLATKKMTPRQFLNYQILIGDSIDDVPPIPEIGTPAKAMSIVKAHSKLSEYFEGTKEGQRIYRKYVTELHRNRQMVTMDKECWPLKDCKFHLTGSNPDVSGLGALKAANSKKSLFG